MFIEIHKLSVQASIGVYDEEKQNPQTIIITVKIEVDGEKASSSDQLEDTVDYELLTKLIIREVKAKHFQLLEHLLDSLSKAILGFNGRIQSLELSIEKPKALAHLNVETVIVSQNYPN